MQTGGLADDRSKERHDRQYCLRLRSAGLARVERVLSSQSRGSAVDPLSLHRASPHGARATCLVPSWGATDFSRAAGLPELDEETVRKCIQPLELGRVVADICALPAHLTIQELILWPLVQQVEPL
jgi:hypothetical protein